MNKQVQKAAEPPPDKGTALVTYDYGDDVGVGLENVSRDEMKIPFWRVVQGTSKAAKAVALGGLGAPVGSIVNFGTGEFYDGPAGVDIVPVFRERKFIEREQGKDDGRGGREQGAFIGVHDEKEEFIQRILETAPKFGTIPTPKGTELTDVRSFYGLFLDSEDPLNVVLGYGILPFSSTQIPKYQTVIGLLKSPTAQYQGPETAKTGKLIEPPLWAHRWHLYTTLENRRGRDFFGINMVMKKMPPKESLISRTDPLYARGRELYDMIKAGAAKADYKAEAEESARERAGDEAPM